MSERERALWEAIGRLEEAARLEREAGELRAAAWRGLVPLFAWPAPFITDGVALVGPGVEGQATGAVAHVHTAGSTRTETWFVFTTSKKDVDLGAISGVPLGMIDTEPYPARLPYPMEGGSQPDVAFRPALVPSVSVMNPTTEAFVAHLCGVLGAYGIRASTRFAQASFTPSTVNSSTRASEVLPAGGEYVPAGRGPRRWTEELFRNLSDPASARAYLYGEWDDAGAITIHQVWAGSFALPPAAGAVVRSRKSTPAGGVNHREAWFDWARGRLGNPDEVWLASATVTRRDDCTGVCPP